MKRMLLAAAALAAGLCSLPCPAAVVPMRDMSALSLAAEYYGALNGHAVLYDFDSTALEAHFLRFHYSPAPWLRLTGGAGGSRAYGSPLIKGINAGLALTGGAGLYLNLPAPLRRLSLTAGYDCFHMTAREKSTTYRSRVFPRIDPATGAKTGFDTVRYVGEVREGSTTAILHAPGAGVIFRLGRFAECEIGGIYHYFNIDKKDRSVADTLYNDDGAMVTVSDYKTTSKGGDVLDQTRFYAAVTLHERESGAYVAGGVGYALTNTVKNDNTILPNFSLWGQVGLIMRDPRGARNDGLKRRRRGGEYEELKAGEGRMAEELNRGEERAAITEE
jgi:hypothetical protein